MIVTIHPRVANRYLTVDSNIPVLVTDREGWPNTVCIKGSQLIIAGISRSVIHGTIKPDHTYYMHRHDVEEVKYVTFLPEICKICGDIKPDIKMRYHGVTYDGMIRLSMRDVVNAGLDPFLARLRYLQPDGYLHIKVTSIQFC